MSEAISIFERDVESSIKCVNTGKIRWFWVWMKGVGDRGRERGGYYQDSDVQTL